MSATTILSVIQHYQRSIEHSQDDEGRLLHCINKLYRLPVKVEHLQETGVGKTVNSLRKYNGEIGVAAKALVTKWKAMVAAEEEPAEANNCENNDDDDDGDDGKNGSDHGSSDLGHNDRNSHNEHGKCSTAINASIENTTNDRKSNNNNHSKKTSSQSNREEKSNKHTEHTEHSSSKHKRHTEQGENNLQNAKRIKNDEHDNENKKRDNHKHKTSHGKSDSQRDEKQQSSSKDAKTTSSKQTTHHRNGGGDMKERRDTSQQSDEKRSEYASSSKQHTNDNEEVTTRKHDDSGKNRASSNEKERKERSKESKHDKSKSSSKDSSNRDKHHKSTTSQSLNSKSSNSTTTKQPTSSSSNNADSSSGNSSKRKRHHDSDSNDVSSPAKTKVAKTPKSPNPPMTQPNDDENEGDDDGIDSSMGANFADVLGMLMMPTKKSKKLLSNNKSPTVSTPRKSTSSEKPSSSNSTTSKDNNMEHKPSSMPTATSTKSLDTKPELLSSSTKLAPLDPSIALELPTISANYKPLPHNKTVMECVYRNSGINNTPKPPVRTLTDAEAISHGISSKTMRTKIYSGIRTGQMLQVPSLFDLCIRILQKNIDALEYTGGVPFDVLRPVLERASPIQLLTFEEYNPYLMEDSDCLWQIHVQRSFRSKKREEMESWREMFLRCEEEKERKLSSLTETIKKSQKIIAAPIRKTQLAFVDSMVKPPRNVLRKQEQYGTKEKLVATPAARVASLSIVTPNAAKVGDTRLRVAGAVRDAAQTVANPARGKKAPLMAKTLQFIRGRHKR